MFLPLIKIIGGYSPTCTRTYALSVKTPRCSEQMW